MKKVVFIMAVALLAVGAYGRDFVSPAGTVVSPGTNTSGNISAAFGDDTANDTGWAVDPTCTEVKIPYVWKSLCSVDVKLDIAYWIQIDNCKTLGALLLKQTNYKTFKGCIQFLVSSNVKTEFNAVPSWSFPAGFTSDTPSIAFNPSQVGPGKAMKVNMTVTINNAGGFLDIIIDKDNMQQCIKVGTITIQVRPVVTYNCCYTQKGCAPSSDACPDL